MNAARIAIVGDFDRGKHSHWATEAALFHAAARIGVAVEPHWIGTPSLANAADVRCLSQYDGIWGAPGSPYSSMVGALHAIEYAREHDVPFLGTCRHARALDGGGARGADGCARTHGVARAAAGKSRPDLGR